MRLTVLIKVVTEDSASYPGVGEILPMRTNHLDICKFDSAEDDHYKVVKEKILALIKGETVLQDKSVRVPHLDRPFGFALANTFISLATSTS
jgi:hypothetical protein